MNRTVEIAGMSQVASGDPPMRLSLHPFWLSLGALGAPGCILFAAELVKGYIRHMSTGDQTGVVLGMMFFLLWLLPATTLPILLSTAARPETAAGRRPPRWASWLLLASGCLMIAFAGLYVAYMMPRFAGSILPNPADSLLSTCHAGLLLGFGSIWIGFGTAARTANTAPTTLLPSFLLATAAVALVFDVATLVDAFPNAVAGSDPWALLVRNLLYFCMPSLILVIALVRGAWVLNRIRSTPG